MYCSRPVERNSEKWHYIFTSHAHRTPKHGAIDKEVMTYPYNSEASTVTALTGFEYRRGILPPVK